MMKKLIPILLILIFVLSGCTSQEDIDNNSSSLLDGFSSKESMSILEASQEDSNSDSLTDNQSSNNTSDNVENSSSTGTASGSATSNNSSTTRPSSSNPSPSSSNTNNSSQSSTQTDTTVTKNQVHLYSYVNDRGWVIQTTFDYNNGDTWAELLKNNTEISTDTTYDVNFNTIEYLKYNGKAIVLNDTPIKKSDTISNKNIYKLSTIAGPAKIKPTTMYELINVEHAAEGPSQRSWVIYKYVINETTKTTGTVTVNLVEVREYSKPDEEFNGTIVESNIISSQKNTYTYTSEYGLYAGKTIELNNGAKILLGTDMYWFYLDGNTKRVLCDDYRAYKKVPNNPSDNYWSFYWSMLN